MSARRPKIARTQHCGHPARKDVRIANSEWVPVRNHKVRNLFVRLSDMKLVQPYVVFDPFERLGASIADGRTPGILEYREWNGRVPKKESVHTRRRFR